MKKLNLNFPFIIGLLLTIAMFYAMACLAPYFSDVWANAECGMRNAEPKTVSIYCYLCSDSEIKSLLPPDWKVSDSNAVGTWMLTWTPSLHGKGVLTVREVTAATCPVKSRLVYQSKRQSLRSAVSEFIKAEESK